MGVPWRFLLSLLVHSAGTLKAAGWGFVLQGALSGCLLWLHVRLVAASGSSSDVVRAGCCSHWFTVPMISL